LPGRIAVRPYIETVCKGIIPKFFCHSCHKNGTNGIYSIKLLNLWKIGGVFVSLKLKKETIKLNEVVYAQYGRTTAENDIIVPDVKPDILKILQVDGTAIVTQKMVQQDKIVIQGNVNINVLYCPDLDSGARVKSMTGTQMFTHVVDAPGVRPNMSLFCEAEVEDIEFTLLNSRKINVRAHVGANVKAFNPMEIEVATQCQDDESLQTKGEIIRASNIVFEGEKEVVVRDVVEVPAGKGAISEVFKIDTFVRQREIMMVENKIVVKGDIDICTLYSSVEFAAAQGEEFEQEVETINFMEHQIPFNEVLDVEGLMEDMDGEIDYSIKEIFFDVVADSAGEKRVVNLELTICASIHATEIVEINSIEDAYATDGDIDIKKGMYNIEQLIGRQATQISHRDLAPILSDMPPIAQLINCKSKPMVTGINVEDGKASVAGSIETSILYLSNDAHNPVCAAKHKSEFTHLIEINGMEDHVVCEAKLDIEHLTFNMTTDREVDLRFIVGLAARAVKAAQTEIVEEIHWVETAAIDPRPSIVIYFVQKGDTLWDIAKKYKTTPAEIIESNGLEGDALSTGQQLMI